MHFTISNGFDGVYIKIDKGSRDKREELIGSWVGFDKDEILETTRENLFFAMSAVSNYVEAVIGDDCTFEIE